MKAVILTIALLSITLIGAQGLLTASEEEAVTPPSATAPADDHVYKLRVKDRLPAVKAVTDLVSLLDGATQSYEIKRGRPTTSRLELSIPQKQADYFLSKLSGLGQLISPSATQQSPAGEFYKITIEIFDP